MINKLHNLKKMQLDQQVILKHQLESKLSDLQNEIDNIDSKLSTTGVEKFGAIGDFEILAIHKNSLRFEKNKKIKNKVHLEKNIKSFESIIIEHQKEVEKYKYMLKLQEKEKLKEMAKYDERVSDEFIQAKYSRKVAHAW